jgi:hypothetical protein
MLQERNAAQPDMDQQPLEPADPLIPATEWVSDLRNVMPTIRRPDLREFEALFGDTEEDDVGLILDDGNNRNITASSREDCDKYMPIMAASLSLEDFEPSADFQEAAAFLQSTSFETEVVMDEDSYGPPALPEKPDCDW